MFRFLLAKLVSKFVSSIQYSIGLSHITIMRKNYKKIRNINDLEYKVFSQNGEDGIIDYLLHSLKISKPKFIEIGVGDYKECNSRFFYERTSPRGLIIDNIKNFNEKVKKNIKLWKGDLTIVEKTINSENIIKTLKDNNFYNDIDFISLDIDGTDYWVLEKLPKELSKIFVLEFNSAFGGDKEITVPNINNFNRTKYHYSNLCFGASLKSLIKLMKKKNYVFLGTNLHNINAFFVQKKYLKKINLKIPSSRNINKFSISNIRESRNKKNKLNYLSGDEKINEIRNCNVVDLSYSKKKTVKLSKLFYFSKKYKNTWTM